VPEVGHRRVRQRFQERNEVGLLSLLEVQRRTYLSVEGLDEAVDRLLVAVEVCAQRGIELSTSYSRMARSTPSW